MQDFTYLTHKVIPKMWRNGNHAHIDMLHMYMNNPVHFTMDRNTQNDLILRGKNIDFEYKEKSWFFTDSLNSFSFKTCS